MIAFPEMLLAPAQEAGMKVPEDAENYDRNEFPHFYVFCTVQLGAPLPTWTSHWDNAKVIASIPDDKIRTVTPEQLEQMGFSIGYQIP